MSRTIDTIHRQWLMLSKIPRFPRTTSTSNLKNTLKGEGYEIEIRTIQRHLNQLSTIFPLNYETQGRKYF